MSAKVIATDHNGEIYVRYECPGCKHQHSVPAARWNWNGSLDKPTLSPSVRHFIPSGPRKGSAGYKEETICHYFIEDGVIKFCDDSAHGLKGNHELPDIKTDDE